MIAEATLRSLFAQDPSARVLRDLPRSEEEGSGFRASAETPPEDARVVEGSSFGLRPVAASPNSELRYFLDGAQKSRLAMFYGFLPVYLAHLSACVCERSEREILAPEHYEGRLIAFGPPEACNRIGQMLEVEALAAGEDDTEATFREKIAQWISQRRERMELAVARSLLDARPEGWICIDGGIGRLIQGTPGASRIVGLVKSHGKRYFRSQERLDLIRDMKSENRSTVFVREADVRQGDKAYSFYLKLRESATDGPLHGLVRVEMPAEDRYIELADEIAGWILAERDPLSLPDPRFDRLIYPISLVEANLRARQPSEASLRGILG